MEQPNNMAARLGRVLYWTGCGVAVASAGLAALAASNTARPADAWFWIIAGAVVAAIAFGIGRACLYVLAGR